MFHVRNRYNGLSIAKQKSKIAENDQNQRRKM